MLVLFFLSLEIIFAFLIDAVELKSSKKKKKIRIELLQSASHVLLTPETFLILTWISMVLY